MFGLISIHDVMPETLPNVQNIVGLLERHQIGPITLLIVTGKEWKKSEITVLKNFEKKGHNLAGHGKIHNSLQIKTLKHRIHSMVMSRNSAEHLSLQKEQVIEIIRFSYQWFQDIGLKSPFLYVPPAWAMGKISVNDLRDLPFKLYETLTGIYDIETDQAYKLPLVGFEADNFIRVIFLRLSNYLNRAIVKLSNRPIRIGIHPYDLELKLASSILPTIKHCDAFFSYHDLMEKEI